MLAAMEVKIMYLSIKSEQLLEQINEWSHKEDINALILSDDDALRLFTELEKMLIEQRRTRLKNNEKVRRVINERRKINKNYARGKERR